MLAWLLSACAEPLIAEFAPSPWIPAAARVSWTGPAGHAALEVDPGLFGAWRTVAEADVERGPASLPLALLPPGSYRWRVRIDRGDRRWSTGGEPFDVPDPPAQLGDPRLDRVDRDRSELASHGYWVGYHFAYRWETQDAIPFVLDGDGEVVWWAPPDPDGGLAMRVRPSADRRSILVLEDFEDGSRRALHRYALDGFTRGETAVPDATHDFGENADGTVTYLAYAYSDAKGVPGQPLPTAADRVRTVPEGSLDGAGDEEFDFFEDFPRDPWYPCDHADFDSFVPDAAEWTHVDSLIPSPRDDGWLLQSRHLDATLLVRDRSRVWQAGGQDATLSATDAGAAVHHGHASDAWLGDDGATHLLVFDNGNHTPEPIVSRVVELAIDPDEGTVGSVWSLRDPTGGMTNFLGDARRLPRGNTVVVWTPRGEMAEYTPGGEPVWELSVDGALGRGFWVPDLRP